MAVALSRDLIQRAPKVLLHDHLDGGLRPTTVLELARESHYTGLPTNDPEELRQWFIADTPGSDLVRYLEGFAHTTAVMQTKDHWSGWPSRRCSTSRAMASSTRRFDSLPNCISKVV